MKKYTQLNIFQNVQLPKLPVPELETTMESYLEFASVVVSQQALEHSRGLVRGFMEELGPRLQETLTDRQKEMDNWVRKFRFMKPTCISCS